MTTLPADLRDVICLAGVQPSTDKTPLNTPHYTAAQGIRFRNGIPEKIGGWKSLAFAMGRTISGVARSILSVVLNNSPQTIIGTNTDLYSLHGQQLINTTPLQTTTIAIPSSLATDYGTLVSNPLSTQIGTGTITVQDPNAQFYQIGDNVTLAGAVGFGGILAGAINTQHAIRSIGVGSYTISTSGTATSSASGGGASVVRSTGRITVTATAHGDANGARVGILGATSTGGISATLLNAEFIIRNAATNTFDIFTSGTATSAVTSGGGTGTTYQNQLKPGNVDASFGVGYGMGYYGVGLYGVAGISTAGLQYPLIWFMDRFGESVILTPGNQGGLYTWSGDTTAAPALVANAPPAINYAFISNNIVVTFGANAPNQIFASDQDDMTNWTGSSTNQVFEDNVEGAERLISHVSVNGANLIFTENQTYTFTYIGLPNVWSISQLEKSIGIAAPMARVAIKGYAYWMGKDNFYRWWGGNVEIVPANDQIQSTILNYVFQNLNFTQKSKIFCWYNADFDEIWWHIPSAASNEPDRVARLCLQDMSWVPDVMPRTAAEYPQNLYTFPLLIDKTVLYNHESGVDADTDPLPWALTTNLKASGKPSMLLSGFIPDSEQVGNINVNITSLNFPQSKKFSANANYTVAPDTDVVAAGLSGRYFQWTLSGNVLGQTWKMGKWQDYLQQASPR